MFDNFIIFKTERFTEIFCVNFEWRHLRPKVNLGHLVNFVNFGQKLSKWGVYVSLNKILTSGTV
jgi:hypothetical protein